MSESFRVSLCACVALATCSLGAADEPSQTIRSGGLSFQAPAAWKSSKPTSRLRLAQLKADPVQGEADAAELVVFAFPGGAGGVDANLKRWQEQFQDDKGNPPKITSEMRKGQNAEVTFAETSGRYVAAVAPGSSEKYNKPHYRLLGAIVITPETGYFLKMVGPDKTMKAAKPAFEALVKSIKVGD